MNLFYACVVIGTSLGAGDEHWVRHTQSLPLWDIQSTEEDGAFKHGITVTWGRRLWYDGKGDFSWNQKMSKYCSYTSLKLGIEFPEFKISTKARIVVCCIGIHSFLYNQAGCIFEVVLAYTFYVSSYVGLNLIKISAL